MIKTKMKTIFQVKIKQIFIKKIHVNFTLIGKPELVEGGEEGSYFTPLCSHSNAQAGMVKLCHKYELTRIHRHPIDPR